MTSTLEAEQAAEPEDGKAETAGALLNADAVRERTTAMLEKGLAGELDHFRVRDEQLAAMARDVVAELEASSTADAGTPFRSCWRLFDAGGHTRWESLGAWRQWGDVREMGRSAFDLAAVAALLGTDPGMDWSYREEATGEIYRGVEGVAVATIAMFAAGLFSSHLQDPLRADASALARLTDTEIAAGLQHDEDNPIVGFEGRCILLRRLGDAVSLRDDLYATRDDPRPGGLFDVLFDEGGEGVLSAGRLLDAVLDGFVPIWPERAAIDGVPLGDTWCHPVLAELGDIRSLIPLHTQAQALSYSLVEPLLWAGRDVGGLDGLTGLADLAHGNLFLACGVLEPADRIGGPVSFEAGALYTVEWRALSVALLDVLAREVRAQTGLERDALPLACIMEGGTLPLWRKIALEKGADAVSQLRFDSDGTVI